MDIEKFTERARGFIQAAQTIAIRDLHPPVEPHLQGRLAVAWRGFDQKLSSLRPAPGDVAPAGPLTLAVARIEQHYV
ncbi:MAG: hypothetical protein ACK5PI_05285, partial [Acetobacteraceae bacterium]